MHDSNTTWRTIGPLSKDQIERFWSNIDRREPSECWPWRRCLGRGGYGIFAVRKGILRRANRVAYYIDCGVEPRSYMVCHKCDRPSCCNPDHLFLDTQRGNLCDAHAKGRMRCRAKKNPGTLNGRAKLNEALVAEIRESQGTVRELARQYGVSPSLISKIRRGELWKDVVAGQNVEW